MTKVLERIADVLTWLFFIVVWGTVGYMIS
jgi:hypothetical protein